MDKVILIVISSSEHKIISARAVEYLLKINRKLILNNRARGYGLSPDYTSLWFTKIGKLLSVFKGNINIYECYTYNYIKHRAQKSREKWNITYNK